MFFAIMVILFSVAAVAHAYEAEKRMRLEAELIRIKGQAKEE